MLHYLTRLNLEPEFRQICAVQKRRARSANPRDWRERVRWWPAFEISKRSREASARPARSSLSHRHPMLRPSIDAALEPKVLDETPCRAEHNLMKEMSRGYLFQMAATQLLLPISTTRVSFAACVSSIERPRREICLGGVRQARSVHAASSSASSSDQCQRPSNLCVAGDADSPGRSASAGPALQIDDSHPVSRTWTPRTSPRQVTPVTTGIFRSATMQLRMFRCNF